MATAVPDTIASVTSIPRRLRAGIDWRRYLNAGLLLPLVLVVAFVSHAYNMLSYPNYTGDEGIYMEQAWSVLKGVGLSPYTYFYDHAPAGWIFIAAWLRVLPGGPGQWGPAINSGRVFILVLALFSTALLYKLARRFSGSDAAAAVAAIVFALSPLSLYYGRMVLLDNIMVFWLLVALELLTGGRTLFALLGGGVAFGIALLTKENAIYFAPVLLYALYAASRTRHFFPFGVMGWLYLCLSIVSLYPIFALLKGELFGTPDFLLRPRGGDVNLLGAIEWQLLLRQGHGSIMDYPRGAFWGMYFTSWAAKDAVILVAGAVATAFNIVAGAARRDLRHPYLMSAALTITFALYLVRGAVLLEFYILPLLPFLALNIGLAAHALARPLSLIASRATPIVLVGLALVSGAYFVSVEPTGRALLRVRQTGLEAAQLAYIRRHVPCNAIVMISDDLWVDLHENPEGPCPSYPSADSHFKISSDPAVDKRLGISGKNGWRRINYVVVSYGLANDLKNATNDFDNVAKNAYDHSIVVWRDHVSEVEVEVRKVVVPGSVTPLYWFDTCTTGCATTAS